MRFRALPASVWALGFVSMFMDISSELVHSLLPVFMATVLGASMTTIGLIEGIAEATAAIVKVFSGAISDYLGKRKLLAVLGYGLAAFTKPIFPLATTIGWVFTARFVDRIGKGIRVAPRDALVADVTPKELRGAAYGLRQSLDSIGAFVGPLLAVVLMIALANDIRAVLWVAVIPAFLAVALLVFGVREPDCDSSFDSVRDTSGSSESRPAPRAPIVLADAKRLSRAYWAVVGVGFVFGMARFSEAFLVLRAEDIGLTLSYVPVVMIVMNVVYALVAYPAGVVSDHFRPRLVLIGGLVALVIADAILAAATSPSWVFIGAAFWGLHMGVTQGLFSKLVADTAPVDLRGTAFGVYNLITGVSLLLASAVAGVLWNYYGAAATFAVGAVFASLTMLALLRRQ